MAVLVLAMIAFNLSGTTCDPARDPLGSPRLSSEQPAPDDPCADFCVPDCFCCSSAMTTDAAPLLADSGPVVERPHAASHALAVGVPPLADHPPRPLA